MKKVAALLASQNPHSVRAMLLIQILRVWMKMEQQRAVDLTQCPTTKKMSWRIWQTHFTKNKTKTTTTMTTMLKTKKAESNLLLSSICRLG